MRTSTWAVFACVALAVMASGDISAEEPSFPTQHAENRALAALTPCGIAARALGQCTRENGPISSSYYTCCALMAQMEDACGHTAVVAMENALRSFGGEGGGEFSEIDAWDAESALSAVIVCPRACAPDLLLQVRVNHDVR